MHELTENNNLGGGGGEKPLVTDTYNNDAYHEESVEDGITQE